MAIITITGITGSGAPETGSEVARILNLDYVDRLILAESAKRIGATVEAVSEKAERRLTLRNRLARFMQNLLERSAAAGVGGDPYFGPGLETLLGRGYSEIPEEPISHAQEIQDSLFIRVTNAVIEEVAQGGNVVIIGRAANVMLKDHPRALHVWLLADMPTRLRVIMEREKLGQKAAEKFIWDTDRARAAYYKRYYKVAPDDPRYYHVSVNTTKLPVPLAAKTISQIAVAMGI